MASPVYSAGTVAQLLGIPYSKEEDRCPQPPLPAIDGFVTFFDPGWSIFGLRGAVAGKGSIICPQSWYGREEFARKQEPPRYRQLRMHVVEGSFEKTFAEQRSLLPDTEEVPHARVVVMGMALHFLAIGERLFPNHWLRCQEKDSYGYRVIVGIFDRDGLLVNTDWDNRRNSFIGLASSRKS